MQSEPMHFPDAACRPIPAATQAFGLGLEEA